MGFERNYVDRNYTCNKDFHIYVCAFTIITRNYCNKINMGTSMKGLL